MKIPSPDNQRATYLAQLQPHVPEPILAIGFLTSAGYTAGLVQDHAVGKLIGMQSIAMGRLFRKQRVASRVAESRNDLVAVTASSVYRFAFPMRGEAFTVSGPPIVWDRSEIHAVVGARSKYTQPLRVEFRDGSAEDFDISNGAGPYATFSDAMLDLLLTPVAA